MRNWTVILAQGFSNLGHAYSHLFILLYATVVLVLEREWSIGYAELIALSIPMTVLFGAGALPAGWLADRWSAAGMMVVFFIGTGAASIVAGFAQSPWGIGVGLGLIGLFGSIYHPVGIPWLVKNAPNHGRALGLNGVFGAAGTASAALVVGVLAGYFGWRSAFIVPGVVSIVTGGLFFLLWRLGVLHEAADDVKPRLAPAAAETRRVVAVMAVTVLCTGLIFQITAFALPKIFDQRLGGIFNDSVLGIGGMVSLVYGISALAQVVGGELADRFRLKNIYVVVQLLQVPVIAVCFLLVSPALVGVAALMVSLNVAGQPTENSLVARYTPPAWRGRAFGAKFVLTLGIGAVGVAIIPILYTLTGSLDGLFVILFILAALGTGMALLLPGEPAAKERVRSPAPAE